MQAALGAISHPGRRDILSHVLDTELAVGELASRTGMKQPAASQHLRVLREAGLVNVRVEGQRRLYSVDLDGLARLQSELDHFWGPRLAALKEAAEHSADR